MDVGFDFFWQLFGHSLSLSWIIFPAVLFGIVVGAVPGFAAHNTIIILLPFTLAVDVEYGMTFMVALYCATHLGGGIPAILVRSEEHTSELQSLMRISYAVFCLKKKNIT